MSNVQIRKMTYDDIPLICKADNDESESNIEYLKNNLDNQDNNKCSALLALYNNQIAGYHNTIKQSFIKKIAASNKYKEWYHFGDIDPDGFYILEHLKKQTGIAFKQLCMGIDELKKYKDYCKTLEDNDIKKAQSMINKGLYVDTMQYMLENNVKLEQEVVSWKQSI